VVYQKGARRTNWLLVLIQRVKYHHPYLRKAILTVCRWGQIFGGFVAYGIAVGTRLHGSAISGWKIVFLVNGLLTASLGVVFWFVMPDNQLNARWLKPRDRILAIERVRSNQQGIGNKHFKFYQLKEALTDPLAWAITFYALVA
jgi:ACS family allantoate permease-like MFS transporter